MKFYSNELPPKTKKKKKRKREEKLRLHKNT